MRKLSILAVVVALAMALAPSAARAATLTVAFPSAQSTAISSYGFILDGEEANSVGYFWSADRGDRVAQTFTGPPQVDGAHVELDVARNTLVAPNKVDWELLINDIVVVGFSVGVNQKTIALDVAFPAVAAVGSLFKIVMRVTNTVPDGQGAISLPFAGAKKHSLTLHMADCSVGGALGGPTVLGSDQDMTGPVSSAARGAEGAAGPAAPVVHEAGCAAASAGL